MTRRNQHTTNVERLYYCPGSNCPPLSTHGGNVGVCPSCGVRTFLRDGDIKLVQPHKATRLELVVAHQQRARTRRRPA